MVIELLSLGIPLLGVVELSRPGEAELELAIEDIVDLEDKDAGAAGSDQAEIGSFEPAVEEAHRGALRPCGV